MLRIIPLLFLLIALPALNAARVEISTLPGLRYDVKAFYVEPGETVEIVFSNNDDMEHNLVVTKSGAREAVVQAALQLGGAGAAVGYVPDSLDVLTNTPVVASGETFTLIFVAPTEIGSYPFVCTYPGHGFIMFGTMIVANETRPIEMNSAEMPMGGGGHDMHSMNAERPVVKRCFMPDSGPASIAVTLPGGYSYCWDAGAVRFRYAWKGGYEEVYRKPMLLGGDVFYRENGGVPIQVGNGSTPPKFRGYRLDANGYPEFEYEVDGVVVNERLSVEGGELTRRISVDSSDAASGVRFRVDANSEGAVKANVVMQGNSYIFPSDGVLILKMKGNEG